MSTRFSLDGAVIAAAFFIYASTGLAAPMPTEPIGGKPAATRPSVADLDAQVKYQRAFEAVLWGLPAAEVYRFRAAAFESLGAKDNTILAMSGVATPLVETLTGNSNTPYIAAFSDLAKGPVVLEVPAATEKGVLYGQIADAWQSTIADVGPSGLDKGKGGKYLLLPPGHTAPIPEGYLPVRSETNHIGLVFRSIALKGATMADAHRYAQTLKLYYLADVVAGSPPETHFIDPTNQRYPTLPFYDENHFADLHAIISANPPRARDKVMLGYLASLGIEPGKPYAPDAKTIKIMRTAAADAYFYLQTKFRALAAKNRYWPQRQWFDIYDPDAKRGFVYETESAIDIDRRATQFFPYTWLPAKVAERPAVMYLGAMSDNTGKPLQAGKTYKITLPKDVPVRQFWSLIIYDAATYGFIYSPSNRTGLSSYDREKLQINADGGLTIYVGPKPPKGMESNWIPTQGKVPYPQFRLYGPTDDFFNKRVSFPDFELLKP